MTGWCGCAWGSNVQQMTRRAYKGRTGWASREIHHVLDIVGLGSSLWRVPAGLHLNLSCTHRKRIVHL